MNLRSLIQPLDILPVKLTGIHINNMLIDWYINSCKNNVTLYHNLCGKKKALNNIHFSWAWSITFSTFLASDSKHKTNCDTPLGKVLVIKRVIDIRHGFFGSISILQFLTLAHFFFFYFHHFYSLADNKRRSFHLMLGHWWR